MTYPWLKWLKNWRTIADKSSATAYVPIMTTEGGTDYEVLRVSKFHQDHDGNKPHVKTPIREFNDKTALHSKATRDLGVVRVITNNRKPAFVIEPGADVLEWRALTQGVSVTKLVEVMRAGDLGRRVRRRDRRAAKDSREQLAVVRQELNQELEEVRSREKNLLKQLAEMKTELNSAKQDRDRMRENLIRHNEEQCRPEMVPLGSGTTACPLGTAQKRGYKAKSNKPLPGNFENGGS